MIFKSSCIGLKSKGSPGHSKTDIPLMSIIMIVLCGFRTHSKNIVLHKYHFGILYWHVQFHDLNT